MLRRGIGRVGRPGLVGTMARTAVVAGTATAVSGRVAHRQEAKYQQAAEAEASEQQMQAAPPPAPAGSTDTVSQLQQLAQLHAEGALTDEEFAAGKARILGGS